MGNFVETKKFNDMIETFECDFDLARQGKHSMAELDQKIKERNKRLLEDINLLCELSFLLRNGKARIYVEKQEEKI